MQIYVTQFKVLGTNLHYCFKKLLRQYVLLP